MRGDPAPLEAVLHRPSQEAFESSRDARKPRPGRARDPGRSRHAALAASGGSTTAAPPSCSSPSRAARSGPATASSAPVRGRSSARAAARSSGAEGGATERIAGRRAIRSRSCARSSPRSAPVLPEGLELPRFVGGAVGMVGYDWVRFVERIPDENPDDDRAARTCGSCCPRRVVVYDNVRHTALVVRQCRGAPGRRPGARSTARRCDAARRDGARGCASRCRRAGPGARARADGRPAQHDAGGVPRDRQARQGVHRGRATSSRWCSPSSSGCRSRSIPSRSTGTCASSIRAPTSSSCAARGRC